MFGIQEVFLLSASLFACIISVQRWKIKMLWLAVMSLALRSLLDEANKTAKQGTVFEKSRPFFWKTAVIN